MPSSSAHYHSDLTPLDLPIVAEGAPGSDLRVEHEGSVVRRTVLPGGVRVLTENLPGQRSAALGAWVAVGSRDESPGHFGSTHFLEHLLFKGTHRRNAMEIASTFDAIGAEANAATGKEHTSYYARVLDQDLPLAWEVIADMVTSSTLDQREMETEREVIVDELAMADDDPIDVVHEKFASVVFGDHALGRPIGGTNDTVRTISRDAVLDHYRRFYEPSELVITAAGSVDHDQMCDMVMEQLERGGWPLSGPGIPAARRADHVAATGDTGTSLHRVPGSTTVVRPVEQAQVILGGPGLVVSDERRWTLTVLNAILGGGMSSRLFQEIREKRGLAYSTYSFAASYSDAGSFGMYAGCAPSKVHEVASLMRAELEQVAAGAISSEELSRAIGQLRGGLVLGLEDNGSRMSRLGVAEIVRGELTPLDLTIDKISRVTAQDVASLAEELLSRPRGVVVVGAVDPEAAHNIAAA